MHGAAMPGARHYRVTLTAASYPGRLSCFYSMGSAHGTTPPDPVDVLDCLLSDHDIRSECTDALDLAAYFGEIPQTQAERDSYRRSWHSLTQQSIGLRRWLGADLDDIAELERE